MSYEWIASPNYQPGRTQRIQAIVIHWWDDPAKKPVIQGVINHFKNPAIEVSAHYVVSGDRIVQMVKESDTAWHARQANPYSIGIEIDPNTPGNTYATVARLVREIRARHGNLPLKKHNEFNQTSCPGTLDIARIDREARASNVTPPHQGGTPVNETFQNEAEVKPFYVALRGNEATLGERQGWVGKRKIDFILSPNTATEAKNNAAAREAAIRERDAARADASAKQNTIHTLTKQLEEAKRQPAAPTNAPDPDAEEYRKLKAFVKKLVS